MEQDTDQNEQLSPLEIPSSQLSKEALLGLIESFISRYGTDYGHAEISHDKKIEQVTKQVLKGDVKIVFDPNIESVSLLTKTEFQKALKSLS